MLLSAACSRVQETSHGIAPFALIRRRFPRHHTTAAQPGHCIWTPSPRTGVMTRAVSS